MTMPHSQAKQAMVHSLGLLFTHFHTCSQAKQAVLSSGLFPDGLAAHAASSCASGLVATIVSTPADVIKTRLMGQDPSAVPPLYRGAVDCLVKSVRNEGVMALYKG